MSYITYPKFDFNLTKVGDSVTVDKSGKIIDVDVSHESLLSLVSQLDLMGRSRLISLLSNQKGMK